MGDCCSKLRRRLLAPAESDFDQDEYVGKDQVKAASQHNMRDSAPAYEMNSIAIKNDMNANQRRMQVRAQGALKQQGSVNNLQFETEVKLDNSRHQDALTNRDGKHDGIFANGGGAGSGGGGGDAPLASLSPGRSHVHEKLTDAQPVPGISPSSAIAPIIDTQEAYAMSGVNSNMRTTGRGEEFGLQIIAERDAKSENGAAHEKLEEADDEESHSPDNIVKDDAYESFRSYSS